MNDLVEALRDLDENTVYRLVDQKVGEGVPVIDIVKACNEGMVAVGELFSARRYFISQLIFSAEIFKCVMQRLEPLMQTTAAQPSAGKVVIGTVKGDIHDIGKNIVVTLLKSAGFDVIDLGVDVPAEQFVNTIKETGARVLGLSALLNFTYPEMKRVVDEVTRAGLRDRVTILIGGTPCNDQVREFTGADYYAPDAVTGVELCKRIYQ